MDNNKQYELNKRKKKKLLESNPLAWGKYYFPDKFFLPFCLELHKYFIEIMQEPFTNTLAPRGSAKTIIKCFLLPIYLGVVKPELFNHFLNVQSTTTKGIGVNISIKNELEHNDKLIEDYGNLQGDKWTEKQFVLTNDIVFTAIGAGESMRGLNYQNKRPDYIILDDLYDEDDIYNTNRIKKKEDWFWGALYPARATGRNTSIHIQGTAIHKEDLMHKLSNKPDIKFRKFRAIKEDDSALWKEHLSVDDLLSMKERMGSVIFSREYQNECRDDETAIIKESWIKYYNGTIRGDETIVKRYAALDPAIGLKISNDFSGYCYLRISNLGNVYIDELKNEKNTFNDNIETVKAMFARLDIDAFGIEAIAAFKALTQELKRTTALPITEIVSVKDKIASLSAQSHKLENGKVFINENIDAKLRNILVEQLINNNPKHDDLRDSFVRCLEMQDKNVGQKFEPRAWVF